MRKMKPILARLFARSKWTSNNCLEWTGAKKGSNNYGSIDLLVDGSKKSHSVHRVSYEIAFGEIPNKKLVLHKCDNPTCFNPDHLFIGDHKDNMIDMVKKGRNKFFTKEQHPNAKLKIDDVKKIKQLRNEKLTYSQIAKLFNISKGHAHSVYKKITWREA